MATHRSKDLISPLHASLSTPFHAFMAQNPRRDLVKYSNHLPSGSNSSSSREREGGREYIRETAERHRPRTHGLALGACTCNRKKGWLRERRTPHCTKLLSSSSSFGLIPAWTTVLLACTQELRTKQNKLASQSVIALS